MSTSIPRYWVGRPGERDLDLRVSPVLSESRDVRSGDLDLALRISRESTSAGGARPCLKSTNPKPNVTTWRGIISTSPTGNLIGRSGERDLDLLISPDLSGSRDVRSRDLDLALRISKESKSMSGAPPCFTPDEPKRKIAPWGELWILPLQWDASGVGGARSRYPDPTWPPPISRRLASVRLFPPRYQAGMARLLPGPPQVGFPPMVSWGRLVSIVSHMAIFTTVVSFFCFSPLALVLALVLVVLLGWRCFGVGP